MLHAIMYKGHGRFLYNVQVRHDFCTMCGYVMILYNVQVRHDCASQRVQQDLQEGLDQRNDRLLLGHQLRDANPHSAGCLG